MSDLSFDDVSKVIRADFETGSLFWLHRGPETFSDGAQSAKHKAALWNVIRAGKQAFRPKDGAGYLCGSINGRKYGAHRVIWLLAYGEWPADQIDHVNGDKTDNRLANLRSVSRAENMRNRSMRADNDSGITGVHWYKETGRWKAQIMVNGKNKSLGYYLDKDDAIAARKAAEIQYGYHENHGLARSNGA